MGGDAMTAAAQDITEFLDTCLGTRTAGWRKINRVAPVTSCAGQSFPLATEQVANPLLPDGLSNPPGGEFPSQREGPTPKRVRLSRSECLAEKSFATFFGLVQTEEANAVIISIGRGLG